MQSQLVYVGIGLVGFPVFTQGEVAFSTTYIRLFNWLYCWSLCRGMDHRTNRQSKDLSIYSCQFGGITSRILNWRPLPLHRTECMDGDPKQLDPCLEDWFCL